MRGDSGKQIIMINNDQSKSLIILERRALLFDRVFSRSHFEDAGDEVAVKVHKCCIYLTGIELSMYYSICFKVLATRVSDCPVDTHF